MTNQTVTVAASSEDPWLKLGASVGCDPVPWWLNRFIWIGASKTGKSTVLGSMPDGCHLDIEGKAHSVPGRLATRIPIGQFLIDDGVPDKAAVNAEIRRLDKAMFQLQEDAKSGRRKFKHVVFDSVDKLQELVIADLSDASKDIREKYSDGGGISRVVEKVLSYPRKVYSWGYGWSIVTHSKTEVDADGMQYERAACYPSLLGGAVNDAEYILVVARQKQDKLDPTAKTRLENFVIRCQLGKGQNAIYPVGGCVPLPAEMVCPPIGAFTSVLIPAYERGVETLKVMHQKALAN